MVKIEISVKDLKFGMCVAELDRPWEGTPFMFKGFAITSMDQIVALKKFCETVFIDLDRDVSVGGPRKGRVKKAPVRGNVVYKEVTPVEKELVVAKEVYSA